MYRNIKEYVRICADMRTRGHTGTRTRGHADTWTDTRTDGRQEYRMLNVQQLPIHASCLHTHLTRTLRPTKRM